MGTIIMLGILGLLALVFIVSAIVSKGTYRLERGDVSKRRILLVPGIGFALVFGMVFLFSSITNVTARTVGIVTEFGKPTGTVNPGFNFVAPWAEITEFSTTNQPLDLDATDGNGSAVGVKFQGGGSGAANVNLNWQVQNDDKAVKLWENWKEFDLVKDKVVNQKAQSVVAEVIGGYTPEEAVKGENIPKISKQIQDSLNQRLAVDGIKVENVSLKRIDPSPEIQDRINKQVQDQADVNRAKIKQETAKIDAETNLIAQQNLTPTVLSKMCYDITRTWNVAANGPMPASWNCSGNSLPLVKGVN